jgi:hypothetical protein
MLANLRATSAQSGSLSQDVHLPATSVYELLDFIKDELPRWRDRGDRKRETSETALTSQLCAHLNSAARHSTGWDFLQFRIEEPDEQNRGRKIDLVPAPCGATVWIEGRRHVDFDSLLPIECKRLPTPKDKERDEREYVFNQHASTGGIQRFKAGHHGASHKLGAMIAYVQQGTRTFWSTRVADWINELVEVGQPGWTAKDILQLEYDDDTLQLAVLRSSHTRENGLPEIELHHLWVGMN